jgi:putative ABC transport system permease protein
LRDPNSIVLTEEMAQKYFGSSDVLGEVLSYGDEKASYGIAGILKNIPRQSSMKFDFLVPMQSYPAIKRFNWSWVYLQVFTYVKVSPAIAGDKVAIAHIEAQTPDMVRRHGAKAFERIGMPLDKLYKEGGYWNFKLQPYADIHLGSAGINNDLLKVGNKRSLYIFGVIALFIVVLACVNFMNLSTARSFNRARETGVRKVMGSSTSKLILQFLSESVLYSIFASIIALVMVFLFLPAFNRLTEKQLLFSDILSGPVWLLIIGITLISGLLAGTYPAFYLSSFKPVQVLKGTLAKKGGSYFIRNSLVVFQLVFLLY